MKATRNISKKILPLKINQILNYQINIMKIQLNNILDKKNFI